MRKPQLLKFWRIAVCSILCMGVIAHPTKSSSQTKDAILSTTSIAKEAATQPDTVVTKKDSTLWLMGSLSGNFYSQRLDYTYAQDLGELGYAVKVGIFYHNRILQFDYHQETGGSVFPGVPEHLYDYALLYGITTHKDIVFGNFMAGISILNYLRRGALLTPSNSPNAEDPSYQQLNGNLIGVAGSAGFYLTPIPYWGIFGMGLYGCLNKGESYIALEFSIIELNLPLPVGSK